MRPPRDYRPQQLYAVTQRGNGGQWVYRDTQDFEKALELMGRYAKRYRVAIHGYCLLHNHAHWIFEASTPESISNLMRDMQGRYSFYLTLPRLRCPPYVPTPTYASPYPLIPDLVPPRHMSGTQHSGHADRLIGGKGGTNEGMRSKQTRPTTTTPTATPHT